MANISGTNLVAPVVPFTTDDKYPTHYAKYGHGGWRTVNTLNDLNNIPSQLREEGMAVYCIEDKKTYIYVNSSWKELSFSGDSYTPCTKITYDELVSLRDNNNLIPGHQYRIIDYQTNVTESIEGVEMKSAKHQFDIIVTATSSNKLDENAKATHHEFDQVLEQAFDYPKTFLDITGPNGGGCAYEYVGKTNYNNKIYHTYTCENCPEYNILMDWENIFYEGDTLAVPVAYIQYNGSFYNEQEWRDTEYTDTFPLGYRKGYSCN